MKSVFIILILLVVFTNCGKKPKTEPLVKTVEINEGCPEKGVTLQILGSGGPAAGNGRASTGYLVRLNGSPLVMIDAGGGTYLRLQQAGAHIRDIEFLGISHLHPDHASELPALLWSDIFSNRSAQLNVSGPAGDGSDGCSGLGDWRVDRWGADAVGGSRGLFISGHGGGG